jgi:hypothetical protein
VRWIGGGLLAVLLAILIAWVVGRQQASAERDRLETALQAAEVRLNVLEARRLLHHAILQLEARNFGSAQQHAERATRFLEASKDGAGDETTETVLTQLKEFRTSVDPDVGRQVATLVHLARALDDRIPVPEQPYGLTPAAPLAEQAVSAPAK